MRETLTGCLPFTPWLGIEPTTSVRALTRNWTQSLLVHRMKLQPIEPHWPGLFILLHNTLSCIYFSKLLYLPPQILTTLKVLSNFLTGCVGWVWVQGPLYILTDEKGLYQQVEKLVVLLLCTSHVYRANKIRMIKDRVPKWHHSSKPTVAFTHNCPSCGGSAFWAFHVLVFST